MVTSKLPSARRRRRRTPARLAVAFAAVLAAAGSSPAGSDVPAAHANRPADVRIALELPYRGDRALTLDAYYRARATRRAAAVMVVHGGSWRSGGKRRMTAIARALANRGFAVFNVDYTLVAHDRPGVRRQQEDLRAALRWIRAHAGRFGVDPRRIGALGSSAGGHLVSLLATRGTGALTGRARVRAAVTWSAPFDLTGFRPWWLGGAIENLLGCIASDCAAERRAASPVAHVSPDDPPMLIANSANEVIPRAQPLAMAEQLAATGVPHRLRMLAGSRHAIEYARAMLPATIAFLTRELGTRRTR